MEKEAKDDPCKDCEAKDDEFSCQHCKYSPKEKIEELEDVTAGNNKSIEAES